LAGKLFHENLNLPPKNEFDIFTHKVFFFFYVIY
jgi:hypothetical protein